MFQSLSTIHIIGVVCAFCGLNDMFEHTERLTYSVSVHFEYEGNTYSMVFCCKCNCDDNVS